MCMCVSECVFCCWCNSFSSIRSTPYFCLICVCEYILKWYRSLSCVWLMLLFNGHQRRRFAKRVPHLRERERESSHSRERQRRTDSCLSLTHTHFLPLLFAKKKKKEVCVWVKRRKNPHLLLTEGKKDPCKEQQQQLPTRRKISSHTHSHTKRPELWWWGGGEKIAHMEAWRALLYSLFLSLFFFSLFCILCQGIILSLSLVWRGERVYFASSLHDHRPSHFIILQISHPPPSPPPIHPCVWMCECVCERLISLVPNILLI